MKSEPTTYNELAQEIIRDYLRNAVIIDDHWQFQGVSAAAHASDLDESSLVDDQVPENVDEDEIGEQDVQIDLGQNKSREHSDSELLGEIHRNLIETGLLTCGFRYVQRDREKAIRLAQNADIVVLDWHLVDDDGAEALEILSALKGNGSQSQALRFVCIFTGNSRIPEVRTRLENFFGEALSSSRESGSRHADEVSEPNLRIANLIIAIRNKKGGATGDTPFTVAPENFLKEVLKGVSEIYDGLVQLAMLELTQHHRQHLPAILERLDGSLDAAVLLEAGDEKSPVGRGGSFLAILTDEWRSHLEQGNKQYRIFGPKCLELFRRPLADTLQSLNPEDFERALMEEGFPNSKKAKSIARPAQREDLLEWLMSGFSRSANLPRGIKESTSISVERAVVSATMGLQTEEIDASFLNLDALFHQQFEKPNALTQGTLVTVESSVEPPAFLLCTTPSCDAERPQEKIGNLFTFLRTKSVETSSIFRNPVKRSTYCVIRRNNEFLCLEISIKEKISLEIEDRFLNSEGVILGLQPLDRDDNPEPIKLRAIAQLRMEHALAVTAASAADGSRVGVNRVERIRSRLSRRD